MPDPTSTTAVAATSSAAAISAALSATTLALIGVEYFALLWGLIGALLAMGGAASMTRFRAIVYVALSTLVGAAIGHGVLAFMDSTSRPALILGSLIGGYGAQELIKRAMDAITKRIDKTIGGA